MHTAPEPDDPNRRPDDLPWPSDAVAFIAQVRRRIARDARKATR